MKIPKAPKESKRLWMSLMIAAKYDAALKNNSRISYKLGGKSISIAPVHNEHSVPDLNLTLLAVLNGLQNQQMHFPSSTLHDKTLVNHDLPNLQRHIYLRTKPI